MSYSSLFILIILQSAIVVIITCHCWHRVQKRDVLSQEGAAAFLAQTLELCTAFLGDPDSSRSQPGCIARYFVRQ